jgi:7-cyano-7-deazaguanine synthase
MCSICGGTKWDYIAEHIWEESKDRGRDDSGIKKLPNGSWIGNHRATPTTEIEKPTERQPVGYDPYIVFNGMIANDDALGARPGEADTSVLPRVLDFSSLEEFHYSLKQIMGSYAIGAMFKDGEIWLACNYKPIWILEYPKNFYFSSLRQHFPIEVRRLAYRMNPYSVRILEDFRSSIKIERKQFDSALVICSSGLDSTSVASYVAQKHSKATLLHFDYNCKAGSKEKSSIVNIAEYLGCDYKILTIPPVLFGDSSPIMNNELKISEGKSGVEYAHEWVPARNLIMLSMAVGYAEAYNYGHIYLGTNLEESGAYPDNEEQFILDFKGLLWGAVQEGVKIQVHTPLGGLMKHEIVKFGLKYNAPFHLTWSCYEGGDKHCGKCGPCFMRKTAFERNGMVDPVF